MKEFIFLLVNIALTSLLFYQYYNPATEFVSPATNVQCLNEAGSLGILCVECVERSADMYPSRGFLVEGERNNLILKIAKKEDSIDCKQYLHFVDYASSYGVDISIQKLPSIREIIQQIEAKVFISFGTSIIQPQYYKFVVYRWFSAPSIKMDNPAVFLDVQKLLFYLFNAIIIIAAVAWIFDATFINLMSKTVRYLLLVLLIFLELSLSNFFSSPYLISLIKIVLMSASLFRIQVHKLTVLIYFLSGLVFSFHPLTQILFTLSGWILLLIKGLGKLNVRPIWTYLIISHFFLLINSIIWFYMFPVIGDWRSKFVQLALLTLTPSGFLLIQDLKVFDFKQYRPTDPEHRSISLSGYEEEEDFERP